MLPLEAWPTILAFLLIVILRVRITRGTMDEAAVLSSHPKKPHSNKAFQQLQRRFLPIFVFIVFGDRLRNGLRTPLDTYLRLGFYMKDAFFLYGLPLLVSTVVGPVIGACADAFGRKLTCLTFCITSAFSSGLQASPMGCYQTLTIARVLDGISVSIMATAFEAWYVHEFTVQSKLPLEGISVGFSSWTLWSTMAAILALVVESVTMVLGDTGNAGVLSLIFAFIPYFMAVLVFLVGLVLIGMQWNENHGLDDPGENLHRGRRTAVVIQTIRDAVRVIQRDRIFVWLGCVQMMFEIGAALLFSTWLVRIGSIVEAPGPFRTVGLEMGTHLACIMVGCCIYRLYYSQSLPLSVGCVGRASALLSISCIMMFLVSIGQTSRRSHEYGIHVGTITKEVLEGTFGFGEYLISRAAFLLFGVSMGLYWPAMSTIRSHVLPNNLRSTIIAVLRVPPSVITYAILSRLATGEEDPYNGGDLQIVAAAFGILALSSKRMLLTKMASAGKATIEEYSQLVHKIGW